MKKIFNLIIICMCLFFITGCGKEKENEKTEFTMGDTISIKGFDVTFVNYSLRAPVSEKEEYKTLVFLEVNVKNTSKSGAKFKSSAYNVYGPNNLRLDKITSSKYESVVSNLGNIRADGTTTGHFVFPYIGTGEYYLEFINKNKKRITVEFTIYEEE